jgi:hypothetical protein
MDIYQTLNEFVKTDPNAIQKALTTASGIGQGFSPQSLEKNVTDTVIKMQPEVALITGVSIASRTHDFNRKTAHPAPGGAMGESATTPDSNSKNTLASVTLKIIRRRGKITYFLKDVSREYMNVQQYEMQNQLQSHALDLRNYILYGNSTSNTYEFDGLDTYISTNRTNLARGGVVPSSLSVLDDLIDANLTKGGAGHRRVFGMSPQMLSVLSRLETTVRKTDDVKGGAFGIIDVAGGWRLQTYRGIPIIETTATRPIEQMRPTVTLAGDAGGLGLGTLSNGTYYVQVAPITWEGEQLASTEQAVTLSAGTAVQRIKITLSAIHTNAAGDVNVYAYKIYLSTTTKTETLNKIVSAYVYGSDGTVTAVTTAFNGKTGYDIYITDTTPDASVTTAQAADIPLVATASVNPEIVYFWDLDPIQGLGKMVYASTGGSQYGGLVTVQELYQIDDYLHFLIKTYGALVPAYEATSAWVRGLRTA